MLKVYTSHCKYKGTNKLDITVKSGDKAFAPTWKIVMDYKNYKISKEEYTDKYYQLMRKSYNENRDRWNDLLNQEEVVLTCFCREGFCHRYLLKDILVKLGAADMGEIN